VQALQHGVVFARVAGAGGRDAVSLQLFRIRAGDHVAYLVHPFPAQVEYLADEICAAWLLERRLYDAGWDAAWEGEIIGVIGSGLFVRFGGVFEGFLPARRLHGEFFELNAAGTGLVGRTTGRRFRLGDALSIRVESIARNEGKVELSLAGG